MKLSHRTLMILAAIVLIVPTLAGAEDKAKDEAAAPWRLATDAHAALQLQAAADYIRNADWPNALRLLQHLLDGTPDTLFLSEIDTSRFPLIFQFFGVTNALAVVPS